MVGFDVKAMRTTRPEKRYQHLINSKRIFEHLLDIARSLDNNLIEKLRAERDYETLEMYIIEKLTGM
jgi:xylose isomerase